MLLNLVKEIIQGLQLSAVVNFLQRGFELLPSIWTCIIISCHHCTVMQLERWADALRDYEALKRELPGNVEVARALSEVQLAFKKSVGEETYQMWYGGEVGEISSNDQFRKAVSCSGMHSGQIWVTVWRNFSWFTCTQFQRSTVSHWRTLNTAVTYLRRQIWNRSTKLQDEIFWSILQHLIPIVLRSFVLCLLQGLQWCYSTQDGVIVADKWFLLLINFASRTVL